MNHLTGDVSQLRESRLHGDTERNVFVALTLHNQITKDQSCKLSYMYVSETIL